MISRTGSKPGHLGPKPRSPGQIKDNLVNTIEITVILVIINNLAQNVCLNDF